MIDVLKLGRFRFKIRALENLLLPEYKGATFRGGFGQALKNVACALKRQDCGTCLLRDRCVYIYLFETPPPRDTDMMRLYPSVPHPFVLEPPETKARYIPAGECLEFGLVLVGKALELLPYFVYAFISLGERGLGKEHGTFALEAVLSEDSGLPRRIYDINTQRLQVEHLEMSVAHLKQRIEALTSASKLVLEFRTPTRIKAEGHLKEAPEFHHLARTLLRRISSLAYFHCAQRLDLNYRELVLQAQRVQTSERDLSWYDWERYSTRQKQRMALGGFKGHIAFEGEFKDFLPLVVLGETLHVGKGATFGLGRYSINAVPTESCQF